MTRTFRAVTQSLCGAALLLMAPGSLFAQPANGDQSSLNLLCMGSGEVMSSAPKTELEWDRYDHKYRVRSGSEMAMKGFPSGVTIQIYGDDGRIRLPEKLIPPISSGGDHQHWWPLTDVIVGANEIRASYRLNGLNKPHLRIDRGTGEIVIKGFGQDFTGRCDAVDAGQRRF